MELHLQWQHESEFEKRTVGLATLRFAVADPDSLFQEYEAIGVCQELTQLRDTAWGTREFGIRDLDGHGLIFYGDLYHKQDAIAAELPGTTMQPLCQHGEFGGNRRAG